MADRLAEQFAKAQFELQEQLLPLIETWERQTGFAVENIDVLRHHILGEDSRPYMLAFKVEDIRGNQR